MPSRTDFKLGCLLKRLSFSYYAFSSFYFFITSVSTLLISLPNASLAFSPITGVSITVMRVMLRRGIRIRPRYFCDPTRTRAIGPMILLTVSLFWFSLSRFVNGVATFFHIFVNAFLISSKAPGLIHSAPPFKWHICSCCLTVLSPKCYH